jgi:hypothetical protein
MTHDIKVFLVWTAIVIIVNVVTILFMKWGKNDNE